MSKTTETLNPLWHKQLGMAWYTKIASPEAFAVLLLLLGLMTTEPMLAMAGSVVLVGMIAIALLIE